VSNTDHICDISAGHVRKRPASAGVLRHGRPEVLTSRRTYHEFVINGQRRQAERATRAAICVPQVHAGGAGTHAGAGPTWASGCSLRPPSATRQRNPMTVSCHTKTTLTFSIMAWR